MKIVKDANGYQRNALPRVATDENGTTFQMIYCVSGFRYLKVVQGESWSGEDKVREVHLDMDDFEEFVKYKKTCDRIMKVMEQEFEELKKRK